jgi:hypothetical protein
MTRRAHRVLAGALHPLAQRTRLTVDAGVLERRNIGGRRRRRSAQHVREQPAPAHRHRRAIRIRGDGEQTRLAKQTTAGLVREGDAAEMAAVDVRIP